MSFSTRSRGAAAALALAFVTALGCSKSSPTPPTDFGVNITVDASALSASQRSMVKVGSLLVSGAESLSKQFDVSTAISSGKLTFQFVPTQATTGSLSFEFDAIDATGVMWGSGTGGPVTLNPTAAVAVTIPLLAKPGTLKAPAAKCTAATECASGFCTDGVCCLEACKDTCASCALTTTLGICSGYPANTDPEKECVGLSMATGAAGAGGAAGKGAGGAGGNGGNGGPRDASATDAEAINPPDGGVMVTASKCGGTCNGMKACAFATVGTSCGDPFCNTRKDVASLVCDGKGSCGVSLADCTNGYACAFTTKPMACRTTCGANLDCLGGYYCNGNTNACAPTKTDGISCLTDAECNSNHCASGVCCNTACDMPGTTCNNQGSAGKCQCQGVACDGGACQIFYQDADGDGFGNKSGTIAGGTAKAGCAGDPPKGFVADNTDCDDGDINVHPGQTGWFGTPSAGIKTFDYDCSGTNEMYYHQYPGATCKYCPDACSAGCSAATTTTCASTGATSSLACNSTGICLTTILNSDVEQLSTVSPASATVSVPPPITKINNGCCGCNDHGGYTQSATVGCGQTATYTTCSACTATNPNVASTTSSVQQLCH